MARISWVRQAFGAAVLAAGVAASGTATAQPLGVFRWQTQPFCNVLTLAVTGTGSAYRLGGTDDQCGGAPASAIGMAYPKAGGEIGVGLTLVFANAVTLHVDATILPGAGFSGSWRDSVGRAGTLFLTPGAGTGGPLRPVVAPLGAFGSAVAQPPGGTDRGFSATVATDTGALRDAAGLYGRFGGPLPPGPEAPAGVRGESPADVGVFGRSDSGFGVIGGANTGYGVQGHAVAASGVGIQAHHINGGTALNIDNGAIKVSGAVKAAFTFTALGASNCFDFSHPLLNGDPTALLFLTFRGYSGKTVSAEYDPGVQLWVICSEPAFASGDRVAGLVIKQ